MTGGIFGGGVIFVVAALLWAAVLVPSWVRRREFRAAERNAIRLQRTLRVLAETAEVPTEVRVEATAREALAREKLLRTAQRQQEAERKAQLAEARAAQVRAEIRAQQMKRKQAALTRAARLRRPVVRRVRAFAALAAVLALVGVLMGAGIGVAGQGLALLLASASVFVAAMGGLVLLAPGRVKVAEIPAEQAVVAAVQVVQHQAVAMAEPRGVSAAAAAHAAAQAAARARSEHARAMARTRAERPAAWQNQPNSILLEQVLEQARVDRAGVEAAVGSGALNSQPEAIAPESVVSTTNSPQLAASTAAAQARSQELATAERLRKMGVVGDTSEGMLDLDAVLRARRNAS